MGEFLVDVVGQVLIDLGLHAIAEPFKISPNPAVAAGGYFLLGAIFGGASLLILPNHLLPAGALRFADVLLAPVAAGAVMAGVGAWRSRRGDSVYRIDTFLYGYLFALAMALVRLRFAR